MGLIGYHEMLLADAQLLAQCGLIGLDHRGIVARVGSAIERGIGPTATSAVACGAERCDPSVGHRIAV
jgi:hypothetical protein